MSNAVKIEVKTQVEIPKRFFGYDVGHEELFCIGCSAVEKFRVVNVEPKKRAKKGEAAPPTSNVAAGPTPKARFTDFMNHHAACVIKAQPVTRGATS